MNKGIKRLCAMGLILGSVVASVPATQVNADSNITAIESEQVSKDELDKRYDEIMNDSNYIKEERVEEIILEDDVKLVIESVDYKPVSNNENTKEMSNGTNYGTYSSIKIYDPYNFLMGTVGVDVQAKKISSTSAKLNYIRYSNSGFNSASKGAYSHQIFTPQGNPAKGTVNVSYVYYFGGEYSTGYTNIGVLAYPTGTITIR